MFKWENVPLREHKIELRPIVDIVPTKNKDNNAIIGYGVDSIGATDGQHRLDTMKDVNRNPKILVVVDGEPVRTVSERYTPVQDKQVETMILDTLAENNIHPLDKKAMPITAYRTLGQIKLERDIQLFPDKPDELYDYILMWGNSIDGSSGIQLSGMWERLVCTNGLVRQYPDIQKKLMHVQTETDSTILLEKCKGIIQQVLNTKMRDVNAFFDLCTKEIDLPRIKWICEKLRLTQKEMSELGKHGLAFSFNDGKIQTIMTTPISVAFENIVVRPNTEWGFYNALSEITNRSRNVERQIEILKRSYDLLLQSRTADLTPPTPIAIQTHH